MTNSNIRCVTCGHTKNSHIISPTNNKLKYCNSGFCTCVDFIAERYDEDNKTKMELLRTAVNNIYAYDDSIFDFDKNFRYLQEQLRKRGIELRIEEIF